MFLRAEEGVQVVEALKGVGNSLSMWFTEICPWEPTFVSLERSIWLKVLRVPTHVWGLKFFK